MAFKQLVRRQFFMLLLDEDLAVDAIPAMLARDRDRALRAGRDLRRLMDAVGIRNDLSRTRLSKMEAVFAALGAEGSDTDQVGDVVSASLRARSPRRTRNSKIAAS
jgi:hypothetical protein